MQIEPQSRCALAGTLAVLIALCVAAPAAAQPAETLNSARTEFRAGNFPKAISLLSTLLYPNNQLSDKGQIAEAHLLLGVSYFEIGNPSGANQEFEEALFIDRSLRLDPLLFSERAIKAFDEKKKQVQAQVARDQERERLNREKAEFEARVKNALVVEKRDYIVNFAPFGLGQFQNGHATKGTALAITQAGLAGTSLSLWLYQIFNYGYRGSVPEDEIGLVNSIQIAQIGTAVGFYLVWAYGIVDSLSNYKPSVQRRVVDDPDLIKKLREEQNDGDDKSDTENKKKKKSTFRIVPTTVPHGLGIGAAWEF